MKSLLVAKRRRSVLSSTECISPTLLLSACSSIAKREEGEEGEEMREGEEGEGCAELCVWLSVAFSDSTSATPTHREDLWLHAP